MVPNSVESFDPSVAADCSDNEDNAGGDHAVFHCGDTLAVDLHTLQQGERVCKHQAAPSILDLPAQRAAFLIFSCKWQQNRCNTFDIAQYQSVTQTHSENRAAG